MSKNIKLIIGSTRQNRVAPTIATWVEEHVKAAGVNLEIIDLKEVALPAFDSPIPPAYAPSDAKHAKDWAKQIHEADGFIFLTAEYNRSIPSSLKNAIDYLATEWKGKPAAIISYGYIDGGQSATNHLTDILNWLKADIIKPTANIQLAQDQFTDTGEFKDIDSALGTSKAAIDKIAQQLI